ncbi:RsiV family protein [Bordetella sp. 2513F-2]
MPIVLQQLRAAVLATAAAALLAACAGGPPANISLSPDARQEAAASAVPTEPVRWSGSKPGCSGECPRIEIDSIAFPGIPALTERVDQSLAAMTGVDANLRGRYQTLAEFIPYFWATAQPRDVTIFNAKVKDVVGDVIGVELVTGQYLTGAAHGIPATHYLNWQRSTGRELTLEDLLIPGRRDGYVQALRDAHQRWLATNEDARRDPAAYDRMWPFQETDNATLTRDGMVVKYDAYAIAPYSHGQPELTIGYDALRGILRPEFLPAP